MTLFKILFAELYPEKEQKEGMKNGALNYCDKEKYKEMILDPAEIETNNA